MPAGTSDFVANTTIESAKIDSLTADLQSDLNNLTNGTNFWTGQFKAADGTVLLPGITFNSDPDSGFWRVGANNIALSLNGVKTLDFLTTGLTAISADAGAGSGPDYILDRNSASPAASDLLGRVLFQGRDNGGGTDIYASIEAVLVDPVAATEDGQLLLKAMIAGTLTTKVQIDATGVTVTGTAFATMLQLTNPLGPTYGGTGLATYTQGDILYASAANTLAALAKGTAGQVLSMNGGATAPTWTTSVASVATQAEQEAGSSLTAAVTPGRQHFHPSAAKCWGRTTGGGTPALANSYNVTSITDSGTGLLTVTIATDFSSADYTVIPGLHTGSGSTTRRWINLDTIAAGSFQLAAVNDLGNLADPGTGFTWVCFGDL